MNLYRSLTKNNGKFGECFSKKSPFMLTNIFSAPCPPFLFTYFFTHLSWGCPILILDNLNLMWLYRKLIYIIYTPTRCVFPHVSFILLNKNQRKPPPSNPMRTGKFTDLKVTWVRPASVKPGKAIHDASWANSSEASKGESLIIHRIHGNGIVTYIFSLNFE